MKSTLPLALVASTNAMSYIQQPAQNSMGGMFENPMMMYLLLKDNDSSSSSSNDDNKNLLLAMMMGGGMGGGQGGMGGDMMSNPMMMYLLLKDNDSSSSSSSSNDDLLPLMMMSGGMGGMGGPDGGMNPIMMMALLGDDCKVDDSKFSGWQMATGATTVLNDDLKKQIAKGEKFFIGTNTASIADADIIDLASFATKTEAQTIEGLKHIQYKYTNCEAGGSSNDLLPLMMMGGGMNGGMGGAPGMGMDSMLPLLLLNKDSSSNNDNLLLAMMMGGMGGQQGGMGGMNPMMMMMLLDEDCGSYKLKEAFKATQDSGASTYTVTKVTSKTDIEAIFKTPSSTLSYPVTTTDSFEAKYKKCLDGSSDSDSLSSLLPLMMMNQQGGNMFNMVPTV